MVRDQSKWLVGVLPQHSAVARVERIGRGLVLVERKVMAPAVIGVLSCDPVTCSDLEPFLVAKPRPEFILNIPNNASWSGEAIAKLEVEGIAFGKMYDVYRALNTEDNINDYRNPEFHFVERILIQHWNVVQFVRLSERVYRVMRRLGEDIVVVLSQDYEVTADVIRAAYTRHAAFGVLFKTNPYGRISSKGREAAAKLGIKVVDADELHNVLDS